MKIYLPLVSLVVLTFVTSVHSRAVHRSRRSALYYANETGSEEDREERVPQEGVKEVPVSTTFIPVSISSDVKEGSPKDVPHVKEDEETKKEPSQSDDTKDVKPTPEVVATTKQPDLEPKQDEKQDKPEKREESDEGAKLNKEPESVTPAVVIDLTFEEKSSNPVEVIPQTTKEPEPSPTKQEPDSSDKKLEVVTEGRKEGRSGTDEPQFETTSPPLVEPTSKPFQEPEKIPEVKQDQEIHKNTDKPEQDIHKTIEPVAHHSEGTTLVPSLEEKQEPASERPEIEKFKTTTLPPLEPKSSDEKDKREEESTVKQALPTEAAVEVEKSKDEESSVVVISTTPESDKQEGREGTVEAKDETKEDTLKELQKEKQDPTSKPDESTKLPVTEAQSDSPIEETKEEKEVTSPKSGPSKRFADWLDYVPRDFQV